MNKLQSEYPDLDKFIDLNNNIYYYKKNTVIQHNKKNNLIQHNPYGPAVIFSCGDLEYWINDLFMGRSKEDFFTNLKLLTTENTNIQHKINILNIKNLLSHNLDPSSLNILKSLL